MLMNDFQADLAYSAKCSEEPFWQAIYRKAFPDMLFAETPNGLIDRVIYLGAGKTLYIDEKKRRTIYNDILIEYQSNDTTPGYDGWINKDLTIDYIAYAFMPEKKVYLLDWQSLRRAWKNEGESWWNKAEKKQEGFSFVSANNRYYKTHSIAVPIAVLLEAINQPITVVL